jgi:Arc/MetJ-type ribon-helix-helix transcriptional regulator
MGALKKITVEVSSDALAAAQELTGKGVSETVREALARLAHERASQRLRALRGEVRFALSWQELAGKNDDS